MLFRLIELRKSYWILCTLGFAAGDEIYQLLVNHHYISLFVIGFCFVGLLELNSSQIKELKEKKK